MAKDRKRDKEGKPDTVERRGPSTWPAPDDPQNTGDRDPEEEGSAGKTQI